MPWPARRRQADGLPRPPGGTRPSRKGLFRSGTSLGQLWDILWNENTEKGPENEPCPTPRKKSSKQLRKEWEKLNNEDWPQDENGRNLYADHDNPLADGGADDATNITPRTHEDHIQRHKDRGDFKRWGKRRRR